ncbi:MAG: DinB family protein [Candidatus Thorarchaeota archaeon]
MGTRSRLLHSLYFGKPEKIREKWDIVEAEIRGVLKKLTDEDLEKLFDKKTKRWQVLSHVINHGTAHRAQIGAMLRLLGFKPPSQDYIFNVMERL